MGDISKYQTGWVNVSDINVENTAFRFRQNLNLDELAKSLAEEGQKFPAVIWQRNSGEKQLISGFRRVTAAKQLGWDKVLAVVIPESDMNEQEALRLNFVENIERKSLTNLDIMFACRKLSEQGKTNVEIGRLIGKSESQVRRYLKVANAAGEEQQKLISGNTSIRGISGEQLVSRDEQASNNLNSIIKSTRNGIEAKLKIEAISENTSVVEAHISEIKRVWKEALKKAAKNDGRKMKGEGRNGQTNACKEGLGGSQVNAEQAKMVIELQNKVLEQNANQSGGKWGDVSEINITPPGFDDIKPIS